MAQTEAPSARLKRNAGRLAKQAHPPEKKRKISVALPDSPPVESAPASPLIKPVRLPVKVADNRALPTLAERQSLSVPDTECQSIPASAVLQSSLDRSRLRWTYEGIFHRYWVKPETGKNAKPTPPNNPEVKLQKHKGPCRIRIEPHILETEIYVEEKAKPPPPPKMPPNYGYNPMGAPYRPLQPPYHQPQQYYHGRPIPPVPQHGQPYHSPAHAPSNAVPPMHSHSQHSTPTHNSSRPQQPPSQSPQEKKGLPDPVISMLANRASSDPELKALMKEVATGNATQAQLKIFQGHIDDLTKIINDKKEKDDKEAASAAAPPPPQTEVIQYDGAGDSLAPVPPPQQQPQQRPPVPYQHQAPSAAPPPAAYPPPPQQHTWSVAPTPPAPQPVILAFTNPGASEDRFLFPQACIIEALSPQHLLCSFVVTRFGRDAVDQSRLDPDTEYWQPITLMVEVAYNREHLLDCVRKWVKPAEEAKKEMEEIMARCTKAPETFLALRLPFKGTALAETDEGNTSGWGTPVDNGEEKGKVKGLGKAAKMLKA